MKKTLILLAAALCAVTAGAVPAYPGLVTVTQPDGASLTIQGHGDEFYNFITTADGYTVLQDAQGYWTYAQLNEQGVLVPGSMVAHDARQRTADENAQLAVIGTGLTSSDAVRAGKASRVKRDDDMRRVAAVDYNKFRGLVILIQFKDRSFTRSDVNEFYQDMFNAANYTGYTNEDGSYNQYGSMFIGSVRDYFSDNSNGLFVPQFDIVGPVTMDMRSDSVYVGSNFYQLFYDALTAADSLVDYTKYDADGSGQVDNVYFVVAGYGSNYSGNNSGYLWPHASSLSWTGLKLDGMTFGRYSSSVELYGWESWWNSQKLRILDGIGVVVHEFSHVLGLPDLYDTDYSTNGTSHHPGGWDVMASASYNYYSRRPAGYSAFERYALDWQTPTVITQPGQYSLRSTQSSTDSYILPTLEDNEYFILDNRQQTMWDAGLPGHGMIVSRVDSTNASIWTNNKVNAYSSHNYYELLRASGSTSGDNAGDPFPGTANVTSITNTTSPNLLTWGGLQSNYSIFGINEDSNGVITFTVQSNGEIATKVEDFETMVVTSATSLSGVQGRFTKWDFVKANVQSPSDTSLRRDEHSVRLRLPSAVRMAEPVAFKPYMASLDVFNNSGATVKLKLYQKTMADSAWNEVNDAEREVAAYTSVTVSWTFAQSDSVLYAVQETAGSASNALYIDNFTFFYNKDDEPKVVGDINGDGVVNVSDVTALVNMILGLAASDLDVADMNGDGLIDSGDVTVLVNLIISADQ